MINHKPGFLGLGMVRARCLRTLRIDQYGTHYDLVFSLLTDFGESLILSCWIIKTTEDFPRLTNTYPIE